MELIELVEYFVFGVAVKNTKKEIEKYPDILDDNDDYLKEIADLRGVVKKLKSSYNSLYDEYKKFKDADDKDNRELDELRDNVTGNRTAQ